MCSVPRPAMVVSGGKLRPASAGQESKLAASEVVSWELTRLPGLGKEGLAKLLSSGGPAGSPEPALLITCTCGHLFLDPLSRD